MERMRREVPEILQISQEGLGQRLSTSAMMSVLIYQCGLPAIALLFAIAIAVSESIFILNRRFLGGNGQGRAIPVPVVVANWTASTISTLAFCSPTPILASIASLPILVAGLIWFFGVLVHISNSYVDLPIYNRSQIGPAYLTLIATLWITAQNADMPYRTGALWEWGLLVAFSVVHAVNTLQTMTIQRDTRRALFAAQSDAEARLLALERLSRHDPLTRLYNRRAFEKEFSDRAASLRTGMVAIMVIDLDGFKPINDSYGHDAGDIVLRELAARLRNTLRGNGLAARIGGDEFAIGLHGIENRAEAEAVAARILQQIELPVPSDGPELRVGASIGIALSSGAALSVKNLTARADEAMYQAKTPEAPQIVVWDRSIVPRVTLEDRMRLTEALTHGEIRPFYQPKVDLRTGRIVGFEALARWIQPDGSVLLPRAFLPQIEALGLHDELLEAISRAILADLPRLRAAGLGSGRVSLNVPENALATQSGLARLIHRLGTDPGALPQMTLEITEDVLISRAGSRLQKSVATLRDRGALISLDDFGTGYASFQHLRQLDFDELKIDKSFVGGLCEDGTAAVLVEGFLSIARGLGVAVVAEGVETEAQEARLRALGCPFGQGYRYGKAMPLAETEIRLLAQSGGARGALSAPAASPPRAAPDG